MRGRVCFCVQASLSKKRKENEKLMSRIPRKASKHHALRVDRYVGMLNPLGLRTFQNLQKLKDLNLHDGCQTGKFPMPMPQIPSDFEVSSIAVATDQEQSEVTGGEFIFKHEPLGLGCT